MNARRKPVKPRTRLQFGLTTFFVAITLICVGLGILSNTKRRNRAIAELVRRRHGSIVFQHQHDKGIVIPAGSPVTSDYLHYVGVSDKFIGNGNLIMVTEVDTTQPNYDAPPPGPAWLRSLLGDDYAQTVYRLSLESCNDDDLAPHRNAAESEAIKTGRRTAIHESRFLTLGQDEES